VVGIVRSLRGSALVETLATSARQMRLRGKTPSAVENALRSQNNSSDNVASNYGPH